jgi:HD-GYP domain-containing protein (c-di-GMP phosphodiesterase class II)/GGDEF domain-containing protein
MIRGARNLAAAAAAVVGAAVLGRSQRRAAAAQAAAEQQRGRALAESDRLRQELSRREKELVRRRELIERLQRSRRAERDWNHELRNQLQRAHAARWALADDADVRELVLHATIELVGAEKGLLLSRQDEDADGDLDLICAQGFRHDPEHSAIAQRFARDVLAQDRIVREDTPAGDGTAADREIENLVAIPLYLMNRFQGVVVCANRAGGFEELDDNLLLALGDHAGAALRTQRLQNEINDAHRGAMRMLADALEAHDPLRRREAGQAAMLARGLCRRLGLDQREQEVAATAVLLRDVGHVAIPDRILHKPGPLSADERALVQLHPRIGFTLIGELPALRDVASAVLYHHERVDGTGYPVGLTDTAIPWPARVVAAVDVYTALIHERPHRPALTPQQALVEIGAGAGTQFDRKVADVLADEVRSTTAMHPVLADAIATALDTAGLPVSREPTSETDPLTLLPGHRAFHEAAMLACAAAQTDGSEVTVAIVQIETLGDLNRQEGYLAGDRAITLAARAAQLAAARFGGAVYRDSGRRFGILVTGTPRGAPRPDLAAELHTEFAIGPPIRIGIVTMTPDQTGEDLITRAREAVTATVLPTTNHEPPG